MRTHVHLPQLLLVLGAPIQRLLNAPVQQALPYPVHLLERLYVDQVLNALVFSKGSRALAVPLPHEVVHHQPVQSLP